MLIKYLGSVFQKSVYVNKENAERLQPEYIYCLVNLICGRYIFHAPPNTIP